MLRRFAPLATAALVSLVAVERARAQEAGDYAAYYALTFTPQGSLPPLVNGAQVTGPTSITARYGRLSYGGDDDTFNNVALTFDLAAGARSRVGLTAEAVMSDCSGCDPIVGLALDFETVISASTREGGTTMSVGFKPSAGIAKSTEDNDGTAMSASLGVPFALRAAAPGSGFAVTPYLVPALGFGRMSGGGGSESGFRPMLGGGVRIDSQTSGFGAMLGFQKVFIEDGEMVFGAGLSLRAGGGR